MKNILIAIVLFTIIKNADCKILNPKKNNVFKTISDEGEDKFFFSFLSDLFLPKYGEYKEVKIKAPPYTFFSNGSISILRDQIRNNISGDIHNYKKIYLNLFNTIYANNLPSCSHDLVCGESLKAKCAAFVYFIGFGFDASGNLIDLGAIGGGDREVYYNLALNFIIGARTESTRFGNISWSTAIDRQRKRAFELIQYLQAYDYLYTTRFYSTTTDLSSFENDKNNMRDKLADFTFELHSHANNFMASYGRNNNISIIVASAVGIGSIILNDKTTYLLSNQKKPERWAHAANAYIARVLWEGPSLLNFIGEGPLATKNKIAGYGEGSHYFAYAFQAALPFIKTYYQSTKHSNSMFLEDDKGGREYYPCALCFTSVNQEPYNSRSYNNLYKWYQSIVLPNNESPTVDDTWRKRTSFGGFAITGNADNNPFVNFNQLSLNSLGEEGYDLVADYLLTLNYPKTKSKQEIINFKDAGDLIIQDQDSNYLHVNAENGTASKGGWHEHGDVTSFIIAKGSRSLLAMDPPFFGGTNDDEVNEGFHHNVITFDNSGPNEKDEAYYSEINNGGDNAQDENFAFDPYRSINVKAYYYKYFGGRYTGSFRIGDKGNVDRRIEVHKHPDGTYYTIIDKVENTSINAYNISFNLSGDGRISDGTAELLESDTIPTSV